MRPHPSILFFTVLAGAAQGLLVLLVMVERGALVDWPPAVVASGAWLVLALLAGGLAASVFHLGRPERAWRAASQWRSSWLSREVIVLPALMAVVFVHAALLQSGAAPTSDLVRITGALAIALAIVLWVCTAMIYACLRMVQAWATPLTPFAFIAIGLATGAALLAAWSAGVAPGLFERGVLDARVAHLSRGMAGLALLCTVLSVIAKGAWWRRLNALRPASTLQSALAIPRPDIRQMAMGMTGGSFNTREFFHGQPPLTLRAVAVLAGVAGVLLPIALDVVAWRGAADSGAALPLFLAAAIQIVGAYAERWLFFAWAQHPQNLYYQRVS